LITRSQCVKDLGALHDWNLYFQHHIHYVLSQRLKTFGLIRYITSSFCTIDNLLVWTVQLLGLNLSILKRLMEAIRSKRPVLLTKGLGSSSFARPHIADATVNLLSSWDWEILPHPPYSPDLASSDFHLFPKIKKHLKRSALPLQWRCSKLSQKIMCPGRSFVLWRTWQIDISLSKQTWCLCGEVKLIWDCISASRVTLYVVILFK
jgi:hypothetical protein